MSESVLDVGRLRDLFGDDEALIGELLEMWRSSTEQSLSDVMSAFQRADADGVAKAAHAIKGASGNVGADRVMAVAGRVERVAKEGAIGDLGPLVEDLHAAFMEAAARASSTGL
jgi:two-component system sensor histidine kinase/response regulator